MRRVVESQVLVRNEVYKKLAGFPKEAEKQILGALGLLSTFPFTNLNMKRMKGRQSTFRVRVGKYRILFILGKQSIYVFDVYKRSKVYG